MKRLVLIPSILLALSGVGLYSYQATATVNEVASANRYTANGSTTVFSYTYKILANTAIEVSVDNVVKALTTDYTVSGVGASGGGSVTFLAAPANAAIVTILRLQPAAQSSTYTTNEAFPSSRLEKDLDKAVMQLQQLKEQVARSWTWGKKSVQSGAVDEPTVGSFARAKVGGGIDWATVTSAGSVSVPVAINQGGTGDTTAAGARTNLGTDTNNATIDAKGDLLVGSADNTLARLQANNQTTGFVLTADPAATTGLSWGPRAQSNPIINGNMDIWQRGTNFPAAINGTYAADRWSWRHTGTGVITLSRSTTVPTIAQAGVLFNYALSVEATTADAALAATDLYTISHRIEGFNWRHFAQRDFTVSFWVRDTKTGLHALSVSNSGVDRSFVGTYTVSVSNTWEYKTVLVPASPSAGTWNYDTGIGLDIRFPLAAGSNYNTTAGAWQTGNFYNTAATVNSMDAIANTLRITGIKMELGSVATPIQFRPFQDELAACQRYYQKSFPITTTPAQNAGNTGADIVESPFTGTTQISIPVYFNSMMRSAPTVTTYSPGAATDAPRNTTDAIDDTFVGTITSERGTNILLTPNGGNSVSDVHRVHWTADAEL